MNIEFLNNLLLRNPLITSVSTLLMFAVVSWNSFETRNGLDDLTMKVNQQTYAYPYQLITRGLAGAESGSDAMAKTIAWKNNGWDAQLTALSFLCDEHGRAALHSIVDDSTAVNICRIVR